MSDNFSARIDQHFASLTDPRLRKVTYPLVNIVTIALTVAPLDETGGRSDGDPESVGEFLHRSPVQIAFAGADFDDRAVAKFRLDRRDHHGGQVYGGHRVALGSDTGISTVEAVAAPDPIGDAIVLGLVEAVHEVLGATQAIRSDQTESGSYRKSIQMVGFNLKKIF